MQLKSALIGPFRIFFSVCLTRRRVFGFFLLVIFPSLASNVLANMIVYSMAHIQASLQGERAEYLAQAQKKKQKKENAITNAVKRAIKNSLSLKRPKKGYILGPCIT